MAEISFDATQYEPDGPLLTFGMTFGSGKAHPSLGWRDRRILSWDEIVALLAPERPPVGPKDGPCYVPCTFAGVRRQKSAAQRIDLLCLDSDTGHHLDHILFKLREKGWAAIVHSTHSHMTTELTVPAEPYNRWVGAGGVGAEAYLLHLGYVPEVARGAELAEDFELAHPQRPGEVVHYLRFRHQPCPKFRVVVPLESPWLAEDYPNQEAAGAAWKERIRAAAAALHLHHDQSCVDPSRLFYLPRLRAADAPWERMVLDGTACPLWELPDAPSPAFDAAPRQPGAVVGFQPRPDAGAARRLAPGEKRLEAADQHGEVVELVAWAARYGARFEVATALKARRPDVFGTRRGATGNKLHIECPNAEHHLTDQISRTGTYCVNASQIGAADLSARQSGFAILCSHSGCAGRDRLDHLAAMLRKGWLSAADLTDDAFLTPGQEVVDATAVIEAARARREAAALARMAETGPLAGYVQPTTGMSWRLCEGLPGVMGALMDWVLRTSVKPQPVLALGAILTTMGGVLGQRVALHGWGVRSNLYIVGAAPSGSGKEYPITAMKDWATAAGHSGDLLGAEDLSSDVGVVNSVANNPAQVMLLDEISHLLNVSRSKNAAAHMQMIVTVLLKLYSSSRSTYKSKQYADAEKVKIIDQPCVSMFGVSTPEGFYKALSRDDLTSGLLSRIVMFSSGEHDPLGRKPAKMPVPPEAVAWMKAWRAVNPVKNPLALTLEGRPIIEPTMVMMTPDAEEISEAFEREMHAAKGAARKRGMDALYVRARENALKFALLYACASFAIERSDGVFVPDWDNLRVTAEAMRWGCDVSREAVMQMDRKAGEEIVEGNFEAQVKAMRNIIRNGEENGATVREIKRTPGGRLPQRTLDDVLGILQETKEIFLSQNTREGKPGRQRTAYIHRDFMPAEFLSALEGD